MPVGGGKGAGEPGGHALQRRSELSEEPMPDRLATEGIGRLRRVAGRAGPAAGREPAKCRERGRIGGVEIHREPRRAIERDREGEPPGTRIETQGAAEPATSRKPPRQRAGPVGRVLSGHCVPGEVSPPPDHDDRLTPPRNRVPEGLEAQGGREGGKVFQRADSLQQHRQLHRGSGVETEPSLALGLAPC